jgi:hypothetical protein
MGKVEENPYDASGKKRAQYIVADAINLRNAQELLSGGESENARKQIPKLEASLRKQIALWGGKKAINNWINQNDPGHATLEIPRLDWSFLENEA